MTYASSQAVTGERRDNAVMVRAAVWLFSVGGAMGVLVGLLVDAEPLDEDGILGTGLAGLAIATLIFLCFDRAPGWTAHVSTGLGTALVTTSIYFTGQAPSAGAILYLWTVLFSFYFFPRHWAMFHMSLIAAGYATIVIVRDPPGAPLANWITTVASLLVAGVLVSLLRDRVQGLIDRLGDAARTDPLTGLLNRRGFQEVLDAEFERAQEEDRSLTLLVGDLDQFKQVNDRFGHHAGDSALVVVTSVLERSSRDGDVVGRMGGEEFAIIAADCDERGGLDLAERMRRALQQAFRAEPVPLTISFGVAAYPTHALNGDDLMRAADRALYSAKQGGRNRANVAGIGVPESDATEIEALIEQPERVQIVFQPFVALATGHVAGYEALARFAAGPKRPPNVWFAKAHECGLGARLEAIAIATALAEPSRPLGMMLSLNMSPSALASPHVMDVLPERLDGLVIEITEQELLPDDELMAACLIGLRERGAQIAVDDAGSGWSGLQRLMSVQPDMIKLDRSLIQGVHDDPDKAALIESFVRFARRTGAAVCAEGIESIDDMAMLAELDVTYGQGYALARPGPAWPLVCPDAARACREGFAAAMELASGEQAASAHGDRRLELVSARLSQVSSPDELDPVMELVAAELGADEVYFSEWNREDGYVQTSTMHRRSPDTNRYYLAQYPATHQVLYRQQAQQILVSDPASDPAEVELLLKSGDFRACLMLPVVSHGKALGLLEAWRREERPWSRTEINRGRSICFHLGAIIESLARSGNPSVEPMATRADSPGRETSVATATGAG